MAHLKLVFILTLFYFTIAQFYIIESERVKFLNDFLEHEGRPATVVSHLQLSKKDHVQLSKALSANHKQFKIASETGTLSEDSDHVVHSADLNSESTWELLDKAIKDKSIRSPARWLLFVEDARENDLDSTKDYYKRDAEDKLSKLYIHMSTEVYVVFQQSNYLHLHAVYKIKPHLPLIWEEYGVWSPAGFDRPRPGPVAMRRRNMGREAVVATTVLLDNRTWWHMPDYLHREVDTLTKLMYYMTTHLVEWVNGTKVLNLTNSWGYRLPDGRFDGIVREIQEERADMSGSVMILSKERSEYLNYVVTPAPIEALFIFKKPALASVTNIYVLPFSIGVWVSIVVLIFTSSLTLFLAYFREDDINPNRKMSLLQKMSEGVFETLCLVFQQGTGVDPLSMTGEF